MSKPGSNTFLRRALVLALMFLCITGVAWYTGNKLNEYNQREFQRNINIVMEQNVDTMTRTLDKHITLVEGLSKRVSIYLDDPERVKTFVHNQNNMRSSYNFNRVGFIYPDGKAITSDGHIVNLAIRDYFQSSLRGETVITDTILNYIGDTRVPVNIISAPVYGKNHQVVGVVFESIANSVLVDQLMNKNIFATLGSNVLVNNEGNVIGANKGDPNVEKYSDLFVYLTLDQGYERHSNWADRLNGSNSVTMYFERDGGQFIHFAPLLIDPKIKPIYTAVIVNKQTLINQTSLVSRKIYNRMAMIVLIAALGFGYFIYDMRKQYTGNRKKLEKLAYVSPITQGDNFDKMKLNLQKVKVPGYIACMDILDFAVIRSVFGVSNANEILKKVWQEISVILDKEDMGCHYSSDYFAFYLTGSDQYAIIQKLRRINMVLADLSERERIHKMFAIFGLAPFNPGDDPNTVYSNANLAKTSIPDVKDAFYAFYGEEYSQNFLAKGNLERDFEANMANRNFELWYQPKYDCFTDKPVGAEALVRLRDKEGNLVPPNKFIPVFEQDGLIRHLDEYVFRRVCEMQKARIDQGKQVLPVSINLSRASLLYENIASFYANIAEQIGVPTELIPIEITESATIHVNNISQIMHLFVSYGFKLHMDDFGTGYSSLAALNALPFDNVKIDKSIIDFIGGEKGNKILRHIVLLATETNLNITAEGVETKEQIDFLKELDCHCVQGYYYSPPLCYEDFDKLLN